ncbi:DNA polymerase III subunit delta [Thiocapsa imhoffii]|uniref:DNA polymerase III subunit delta n=1 Tax=Thiocapsa imhoffii TaxID=382777 RepID=A0A9X0WGC7_9GAMM|nr:DNA polymerase III subunit delta [Thiocapsa imhoffii]MBK1644206.1 DNA polymerase III subunit delta [Thiocapsa imhoffii]
MRLRFNQLTDQLARGLAPLYLICGDEPYQLGEAARLVREAARRQGFSEREILDQDGHFDWSSLAASADAMSLFSTRKLIELRIGTAKLGKEGGAAIRAYCQRPCPDNLLLMIAPALERKELQSQWAKQVEAAGALVQVWPLKGPELVRWIEQRLRGVGLQPEAGVAELMAERAEGNLLAAVQEIEKQRLLLDPGPIAMTDLLGNLADSARFDLFALTDAVLAGDRARAQRVLRGLRAEGTADILVLWVLARELRMLAAMSAERAAGGRGQPGRDAPRLPPQRQQAIERAVTRLAPSLLHELLKECERVDQAIKGLAPDDPWHLLTVIADRFAAGGLRAGRPLAG